LTRKSLFRHAFHVQPATSSSAGCSPDMSSGTSSIEPWKPQEKRLERLLKTSARDSRSARPGARRPRTCPLRGRREGERGGGKDRASWRPGNTHDRGRNGAEVTGRVLLGTVKVAARVNRVAAARPSVHDRGPL
jgi:hypothetical protein